VSYDAPRSWQRSPFDTITYPLLSDPGSKIIDGWGLRNEAARGREVGIRIQGRSSSIAR
jgi:hypothetical protein